MEEKLGSCFITVGDWIGGLESYVLKSYDGLSDFRLVLGFGAGSEKCCFFVGPQEVGEGSKTQFVCYDSC